MTRGLFVMIAAALMLATNAIGAHEHKVLGTVTKVKGDQVAIETMDHKAAIVKVTSSTRITRDKEPVRLDALKEGTRIVVTTDSDESPYVAKLIQVGVSTKTGPSKQASRPPGV